jgi:hypothetical protein
MLFNSANQGIHISDFRVYGSLFTNNFPQNFPEGKTKVSVYPNPFTYTTIISFSNPERSFYTLYLRDLSGKIVKRIDNITNEKIELNKDDLPAGLYLIELRGPYIYRGKVVIE